MYGGPVVQSSNRQFPNQTEIAQLGHYINVKTVLEFVSEMACYHRVWTHRRWAEGWVTPKQMQSGKQCTQ